MVRSVPCPCVSPPNNPLPTRFWKKMDISTEALEARNALFCAMISCPGAISNARIDPRKTGCECNQSVSVSCCVTVDKHALAGKSAAKHFADSTLKSANFLRFRSKLLLSRCSAGH